MEKPLVSIIIPVYNAQKYIEKCLNSIINQTYKNIEIIVIDDGSTDETGNICDKFLEIDTRMIVVHQQNKGRVSARNHGLALAQGQYIVFVDADDWVEADMISTMIELMIEKAVDLVTTGYFKEVCEKSYVVTEPIAEGIYKTKEELEYVLSNYLYADSVGKRGMIKSQCMKLYKRDLLLKIIEQIPNDLKFSEDCLLNILYLRMVESIYISKRVFYHYRIHSESTVGSICEDYLMQINIFYMHAKKVFAELGNNKNLLHQLDKLLVMQTISALNYKMGLSINMNIPRYIFDAKNLANTKVILYGAGSVGRDYYYQLKNQGSIDLVLWVDKNYREIKKKCPLVEDVTSISGVVFDKIVIAIDSEEKANQIRTELMETYKIHENKIIWKKPQTICDVF